MMKRLLAFVLMLALLAPCAFAEEAAAPGRESGSVHPGLAELAGLALEWAVPYLRAEDYRLTIEDSRGDMTDLTVSVENGAVSVREADGYRIILRPDGISVSDSGVEIGYSYEQLERMLIGDAGEAGQLLAELPALLTDRTFANLWQMLLPELSAALKEAGAVSGLRYHDGGVSFNLTLSPDLLLNAFVRLMDRIAAHPEALDALLKRWDPMLRQLFPDLFEQGQYDARTDQWVRRNAPLNFSEIYGLWQRTRSRWLRYGQEFDGIHADLSFLYDGEMWYADLMLGSEWGEEGILLSLEGDAEAFEGRLTYNRRGYDSGEYRQMLTAFAVEGSMKGGFRMKITPEQPVEYFTGAVLTAWAGEGFGLHAASDTFSLRVDCCDGALDATFLLPGVSAELHGSLENGRARGTASYLESGNGFHITLNQ